MFAKIHKPQCGDNKGSVGKLADYLEKENEGNEDGEKDLFFNHSADQVDKWQAIEAIDHNNKNLGRNDAKFFMLTINPSQSELKHLIAKKIGRDVVNDFSELTKKEQAILVNELKKYSRDVMDIYAKNFNRANINSGADLVYFAKVETIREYKHDEKLVKENKEITAEVSVLQTKLRAEKSGSNDAEKCKDIEQRIKDMQATYHRQGEAIIKTGLKKGGLQLHVHVVVSRNDKNQKIKLSPFSKSRGGFQKLNGKDVMQGFNHEKFKGSVGRHFQEKYQYKSKTNEQYESRKSQNTIGVHSALNGVGSEIAFKVKNKVVSEIKKEALQGHFSEELSVVRDVKTVISLIKSPQRTLINMAKNKLLGILKGSILEGGN
jgi:diadenosine tetraphosphate (Ap4A) HIT family hydrolase